MKDLPGLYLRGKTYWFARQVGGERKFISLKTGDLATAVTKATELMANPLVGGGPLLEDINRYLVERKRLKTYSPASLDSKRTTLQVFARLCHGLSTEQVTREVVQRWYDDKRRAGTAASTCESYMMVLRAFFEWAKSPVVRIRQDNPCDGVRIETPSRKGRADFCTVAQVRRLIDGCLRPDLKLILYLGFHCGLRKNEIIEAKGSWFDLKAGLLHLRKHDGIQFKDLEERTVPLTKKLVAFLKETKCKLDEGYVLHPEVERGKSLYRWDFDRPFYEYVKAQGMEWVTPAQRTKMTPHIMRHTFASLLASHGESIYKIAVWLGDDVRTVQRSYAKLSPGGGETDKVF